MTADPNPVAVRLTARLRLEPIGISRAEDRWKLRQHGAVAECYGGKGM